MIQLHHHQSCPARFEGRVEHVDSGWDGRFRSLEELLRFIDEMLHEVEQTEAEEDEAQAEPPQH